MKLTYWDWVVSEVIHAVKVQQFEEQTELTEKDLDLIVSVLRGNVPFIENEEPIENETPVIKEVDLK